MTDDRTILITGVTGKQGGAVAQALHGSGFQLRGLTRELRRGVVRIADEHAGDLQTSVEVTK